MRSILRMLPWLALLLVLGLAGEALGCPNCKEAVANQDGDAMRLANGYSWSIILMISMPFAMMLSKASRLARLFTRTVPAVLSPVTKVASPP